MLKQLDFFKTRIDLFSLQPVNPKAKVEEAIPKKMFLPEIEALIVQELRMLFLAAVALDLTRVEEPLRNSDQVALLLIFIKLGGQLQLRFAVD